MMTPLWIRSSFAAAVALGGLAAVHTVGCGSGAQTPPSTPTPGETAAGDTAADGKRHHRLPPPAAFDACRDKTVGTDCTVAWKDGEIQGKCETPPAGSPQSGPACRPEGGWRGKRHHGPPPEIVFAACDSKAAGDACTVTFERGTVNGSCMAPRVDGGAGRLLCASAHGRRHGDAGAEGGT